MNEQIIELKDKINETVAMLEALGALLANSEEVFGVDTLLCCIAQNLKNTVQNS